MTMKYAPDSSLSKSYTCTMLGCCSDETTRASSTNMAVKLRSSASSGRTRLIATSLVNPAAPCTSPRHTDAIPPSPTGANSSYLPAMRGLPIPHRSARSTKFARQSYV